MANANLAFAQNGARAGSLDTSNNNERTSHVATTIHVYAFDDATAETPNGAHVELDGRMFVVDRDIAADGSKGLAFLYEMWELPITHPHEISRVIADPSNWSLPVVAVVYREELERLEAEGKARKIDKEL